MSLSDYLLLYALIALIAGFAEKLISMRILRLIKSDSEELYEEITQGYKEGWTSPGGMHSSIKDRPMAKRLHSLIVTRKCSKYMSNHQYWAYRIVSWIGISFDNLFGLVFILLLLFFIALIIS